MKKVLAIIMTLVMLLTLAACGEDSEDVRGVQTDNKNNTGTVGGQSGSDQNGSVFGDDAFSMGAVSGLTYENKFIGIGCKLSDEWSFYSDEQIREMNNVTTEMAGEEFEELMKNSSVIYDMYAMHSNQMDNIIVNLEKVDPILLSGLDLADNYELMIPTMRTAFENMGYTDIEFETGTVTIDGEEFTALFTSAVIAGYQVRQASISIKCNGYLASVTVTAYNEETLNQMLKCFYLV